MGDIRDLLDRLLAPFLFFDFSGSSFPEKTEKGELRRLPLVEFQPSICGELDRILERGARGEKRREKERGERGGGSRIMGNSGLFPPKNGPC